MTKKITLLLFFFLSIVSIYAQKIKLVSDEPGAIALTTGTYYITPHNREVNGITYKIFNPGQNLTMEKGAPALPAERASVLLANSGLVSLDITYGYYTDYENVNILPSKGSLKRNVKPADVPYEFGAVYNQDAFYPGRLAEAGNPYILRDTRGVTVSVYPYQYNPVTKVLRVYRDINVKVISGGAGGINKKSGTITSINSNFAKMYKNHYLNAKTANLGDDEPQVPEMLIVAPDAYVEHLMPLANWKIESGIKTVIAPLSETGETPEDIKSYIEAYYTENPGLVYVLLAGDHQDLPSYSYGISGDSEELWSDTYYAQLEGDDFYPEVLVGRFSGTIDDITNMVSRTLEYETAPLEGSWMNITAGIASNEGDGIGDDGEPDWQHLRNIGDKLTAYGYSYAYEFFDGTHGGNDLEEDPANYMISAAVNQGVGLINYTGHGATEVFATGWYTNTDVLELTNNSMYPFVVSVACNNGTFTTGTSICEAWLTAQHNNAPSGAIAACGSSILMAWAEPMQTQDEMAELIIGTNPDVHKYTLGDLFYSGQLSMLENYNLSETAVQIMQTWVFFGDPSVTYRNAPNQTLAVTHDTTVNSNATTFTVNCAAEGANVAITQNGLIVGTATVIDGVAVVTLGAFNPALPLTVTATLQNYTPYHGTVATTLSAGAFAVNSIRLYPNPAGAQLTVSHNLTGAQVLYTVYDVTGKRIFRGNVSAGTSFGVDTSRYASGLYLLTIESDGAKHTYKFVKQ